MANDLPNVDGQTLVGARVPRRGNVITRIIAKAILMLFRFRVAGSPPNEEKFVLTAIPHTSNWDGFFFLLAAFAMNVDVRFVAKKSLFEGWGGKLLTYMGGIAIDRSKSHGVVEQTIAQFQERASLVLTIAVEGTRSHADKWKSGFYHIAHGAGVPIVMGFCDYKLRRVGFGPALYPTGDYEADTATMRDFYQHITPKYTDKFKRR